MRHSLLPVVLLAAASLVLADPKRDQEQEAPPVRSDLEERVSRTLSQFDVTVTGPPEIITDLGPDDFELAIGGRAVENFFVDSLCDPGPVAGTEQKDPTLSTPTQKPTPTPRPALPRSYVFYFDQKLMTFMGRHRSIGVARSLIDDLIVGSARGTVVSSALSLEIYGDWTTSASELHASLDRLDQDRAHWDSYGVQEEARVDEIVELVQKGECPAAQYLARRYERDEMVAAKLAMERVSGILGMLAADEPPKIFFYFSDMMRMNSGEHYQKILGPCIQTSMFTRNEFSMARVLEEAAVAQVRFYPVHAVGLVARQVRFEDTKATLATMGLETGGRAFLRGATAAHMAQRVNEDLSCLYLIGFDPEPFPRDKNLTVTLRSTRKGVRVQARGLIAVQSEERRRVSRLIRAFVLGGSGGSEDVRMESMPVGYADGKFQVLFQAVVPSPGVEEGTWDFGISVVRKKSVTHERSGRLERVGPDKPLVIESVLSLKRGSHDVVGVLDEPETGRTLSAEVERVLELPEGRGPRIMDVKLFAESPGVYWRDGRVRPTGSLIVADGGEVLLGSKVTIKWLVCRDPESPGVFIARRALSGLDVPIFDRALEVNLEWETCLVFQNSLPPVWLSQGELTFDVEIYDGETVVDQRSATFRVER